MVSAKPKLESSSDRNMPWFDRQSLASCTAWLSAYPFSMEAFFGDRAIDAESMSLNWGLGCGYRGRWQGKVDLWVEARSCGADGGDAIATVTAMGCFPDGHLAIERSDGHLPDDVVGAVLVCIVDDFALGFEGENGSGGGLAVGLGEAVPGGRFSGSRWFCHASRRSHIGAAGTTGSPFLGLPLDGAPRSRFRWIAYVAAT